MLKRGSLERPLSPSSRVAKPFLGDEKAKSPEERYVAGP
jgi:hypothetical protein